MATYTTNFNLEKPAQNEAVDVDVLNSNSDIIDDNLGQARQLALNIGYGYNNAVPYFVGDYCVYQNKLYKCIQNILTPEDFDETKWQQCTLGGELQNIKGNTDDNVTDVLVKLKIGEKVYKICDFANKNLANEYSASSTYEVGDYVIYEDDLYKCITAVSTAEPFDSNKWDECLVTDEAGTASVINGVFIDTDNVIQALTSYTQSNSWSYIATEDCVVYIELVNEEGYTITLKLNGKEIISHYDDTKKIRIANNIFIKKGQELTLASSSYPSGVNTRFAVYGIQQGSQETTNNEIYSTDERVVGTWIDGSTVYQKTFELTTAVIVNNSNWTSTGISKGDVDKIISCEGMTSDGTCWGDLCATTNVDSYINLLTGRNEDTEEVKYFTIRYTKSTT